MTVCGWSTTHIFTLFLKLKNDKYYIKTTTKIYSDNRYTIYIYICIKTSHVNIILIFKKKFQFIIISFNRVKNFRLNDL